jgi:NADPH:quinone reductase-like Zn-dependent oxidoreductase
MKAAVLKEWGKPLYIENVQDPIMGTGEVIVDIAGTNLPPYAAEVFSGTRKYPLVLPAIPGAGGVGRVRAVGPDATQLAVGDWVYCDTTVRSRDNVLAPDITLQGLSARGEGGLKLQRYYHDGALAEQMRVPTENAVRIGGIDAEDAGHWCALGVALVPYGGFLAAGFQCGEIVLISGATGYFGSAAVAVALAMGAACVVAPGRNEKMLGDLVARFGPRVRAVVLTGNSEEDGSRMKVAAPGPIDCVLDILPPSVGAGVPRTALMTVRPYGRVVLMGGVGMLGGDDLALPYPWIMRNCITIHGQWMYPQSAVPRLIALARSGLLDLSQYATTEFSLDAANDAVAHAGRCGGPFKMTIVTP